MKVFQWIIGFLVVGFLSFYFFIEKQTNETKKPENTIDTALVAKVMQRFNEKGELRADVEMLNGVYHGIAHNYYKNGSVHTIINYKNGKKEGLSTWFYENGTPYLETPFVNGEKQGIQKKYYDSGKIMAEIPYNKNELQPGTIEYSKLGKPIEKISSINVIVEDKTDSQGTSIIEVSGKSLKNIINYEAFYYQNENKIPLKFQRNIKTIWFPIPSKKDEIKTLEIFVWLTVKTQMNNKSIIEKRISVDLDQN